MSESIEINDRLESEKMLKINFLLSSGFSIDAREPQHKCARSKKRKHENKIFIVLW
jgi:hypothetical protein